MFSLAVKASSVIIFVLSILGTLYAQAKIIKGTKESKATDSSIYEIMFFGLSLVEVIPILSLIVMVIVFLKY